MGSTCAKHRLCSNICGGVRLGRVWTSQTFSSYTGYHSRDHESSSALCVHTNLTPCQIKTASLPIMPFDSPLLLKRIQSALYSPYVHSQILSQKSRTQYFLSFLISQKNSLSWKPIYFSFHSLSHTHTHTHAHITFMLTQYTVLYSQYKAWRQVLD